MSTGFHTRFFADSNPAVVNALNQKLSQFLIRLTLAHKPSDDEERRIVMKKVFDGLRYQLLRLKLVRSSIRYSHDLESDPSKRYQIRERDKPWFRMSYVEPGKQFDIELSDIFFAIKVEKLPLRTIVTLAAEVFQPLLVTISTDEDMTNALEIVTRLCSIEFQFHSVFRLGSSVNGRFQAGGENVKNHEVLLPLFGRPTGSGDKNPRPSEQEAFPSLSIAPSDILRLDMKQIGMKRLGDSTYVIRVVAEAPLNEHNSILWVTSAISADEENSPDGTGFHLDRSLDPEVPFMLFYKDIILKRFMPNLLCSADYAAIDS